MNLEEYKKRKKHRNLDFEDLVLLVDKRKEEDSFVIALRLKDVFYIYENGETHEISDKENFEMFMNTVQNQGEHPLKCLRHF